jgi:uncharacterized protein with GYD domain
MAKFMIKANYTLDGLRGLLKDGGSGRRDAVQKMVEGLGGQMESFYFAFGEDDVYVVGDLPDNKAVASVALAVGASGAVTTRSVLLLTPEEIDAATRVSVDYRPPGG